MRKDIVLIKSKLEKLEKAVDYIAQSKSSKISTVGSFIDSLSANTLKMDTKTVEICSIISCFLVGTVIGASLLDRLWLLSGIVSAYWASGAVYR